MFGGLRKKLNDVWSGADFWDQNENRAQRVQAAKPTVQTRPVQAPKAPPVRTINARQNNARAIDQSYGSGFDRFVNKSRDMFDANTQADRIRRFATTGIDESYDQQQRKQTIAAQTNPKKRSLLEQVGYNVMGAQAEIAKVPSASQKLVGTALKSDNPIIKMGTSKFLDQNPFTGSLNSIDTVLPGSKKTAGKALQSFGANNEKLITNKLEQSRFGQKESDNKLVAGVSRALGQLSSQVAANAVAPGSGAAIGSVPLASSEYDKAKQAGKTDDQALSIAGAQGAVSAGLEQVGLDKLGKGTGTRLVKGLKNVLTEGGTEGLQQFGQNLVANKAYNPKQSLTEGIKESVLYGGIAGGVAGSVMGGNTPKRPTTNLVSKPAPTPQPNLNRNEAYTLSDQQEVNLGRIKDPRTVNAVSRDAFNIAKRNGIDITSGSPREINDRINSVLEQPQNNRRFFKPLNEGGYVQTPGKPDYRSPHQIDSSTSRSLGDIKDVSEEVNAIKSKFGLSNYDQKDIGRLQRIVGNPEAEVKIYRSSPVNELNDGDWVTTSRTYANDIKRQNGGKVYEYTVKAKELNLPANIEDNPSLARFSAFQYKKPKKKLIKPLDQRGSIQVPGGKNVDPLESLKQEARKEYDFFSNSKYFADNDNVIKTLAELNDKSTPTYQALDLLRQERGLGGVEKNLIEISKRTDATNKQTAQAKQVAKKDLDGFTEGKSALQRGKIEKTLDSQIRYNGQVMSKRDYIRKLVNDGYVPDEKTGSIYSPNDRSNYQAVTKTEADYARHLYKDKTNSIESLKQEARKYKSELDELEKIKEQFVQKYGDTSQFSAKYADRYLKLRDELLPKAEDAIIETQGLKKVYHGTTHKWEGDFKEKDTFFTPNKKFAENVADEQVGNITEKLDTDTSPDGTSYYPTIVERYLPKDSKIFDATNKADIDLLANKLPENVKITTFIGGEANMPKSEVLDLLANDKNSWQLFEGEIKNIIRKNGYDGWKASEKGYESIGLFNPNNTLKKQQLTDLYNQATQSQPPKSTAKTVEAKQSRLEQYGWRSETTSDGTKVYNRNGKHVATIKQGKNGRLTSYFADGEKMGSAGGSIDQYAEKIATQQFYAKKIEATPQNTGGTLRPDMKPIPTTDANKAMTADTDAAYKKQVDQRFAEADKRTKEMMAEMKWQKAREKFNTAEEYHLSEVDRLYKKYKNKTGYADSDIHRLKRRIINDHFDELDPETQVYFEHMAPGTDFENISKPSYRGFADASGGSGTEGVHASQIYELEQVVDEIRSADLYNQATQSQPPKSTFEQNLEQAGVKPRAKSQEQAEGQPRESTTLPQPSQQIEGRPSVSQGVSNTNTSSATQGQQTSELVPGTQSGSQGVDPYSPTVQRTNESRKGVVLSEATLADGSKQQKVLSAPGEGKIKTNSPLTNQAYKEVFGTTPQEDTPEFNAVAAGSKSNSTKRLMEAISQDEMLTQAAAQAQQDGKEINFFAKKDRNGRSVGIERFDPRYHKIEAGFVTDKNGNVLGNHIKVDETGMQVNVGGDVVNMDTVLGNPQDWEGHYEMSSTMERNIYENAPNKEIADKTYKFVVANKIKHEAELKTDLANQRKALNERTRATLKAKPRGVSKKEYKADVFDFIEGNMSQSDLVGKYGPQTSQQIISYKNDTRRLYDTLLDRVNTTFEQFGEASVPRRKDYITHINELISKPSFAGELYGQLQNSFLGEGQTQTRGEVPANIAGRTENFEPRKKWNRFFQARRGGEFTKDPFKAVDAYLEPTLYNIHMTEPAVRARAVEAAFRTAREIKETDTKHLTDEFNTSLDKYKSGNGGGDLVTGFQEYANAVTGKTQRLDRQIIDQGSKSRLALHGWQKLQAIGGRATILGNVSSVLAQPLNQVGTVAQSGPINYMKGLAASVGGDKTIEQSPFITARRTKVDSMFKSRGQKVLDAGGVPLQLVEMASVEQSWNAIHQKVKSEGYTGKDAILETDRRTERTVAGRGIADKPELYRSTVYNGVLQYTLEVNASNKQFWRDLNPRQKATFLVASTGMNMLMEAVTGYEPLPDFLGAMIDTAGDFLDEEDDASALGKGARGVQRMFGEYVSQNPIASATANILPQNLRKDIFGKDAQVSRFEGTAAPVQVVKNVVNAGSSLAKGQLTNARDSALKVAPFGNQAKKTITGAEMLARGYAVNAKGEKTFDAPTSPVGKSKALLFGPNSSGEARQYYDKKNGVTKSSTPSKTSGDLGEYGDVKNVLKAQFDTKEGREFLAMNAAEKKEAAKNDTGIRQMYEQYNTTKRVNKASPDRPAGLAKNYETFLNGHAKRTPEQRERLAYSQNDYDLKLAEAKYEEDKLKGKVSRAEKINRDYTIKKAQVGAKFSKDVRESYNSLSKAELTALAESDPNGQKIWDDAVAYGDALVEAGLLKKNKLKTKSKGGGKGRRKGKGRGGKGGRGGKRASKYDYTKDLFGSGGNIDSNNNTKALRAILAKAMSGKS